MILVIDNYDSFVHNVARYIRQLGAETLVVRNDQIDADGIRASRPKAVVISPGPCTPREAGCSLDVVRSLHAEFPILGICLGHQVIAEAFGAQIVRAASPVHGQASLIFHEQRGPFADLPSPFHAGRYHSLVVAPDSVPDCLRVTATLEDGTIMALQHVDRPLVGWQFHPESILTRHGYEMLAAFLRLTGMHASRESPEPPRVGSVSPITEGDWFRRAIDPR